MITRFILVAVLFMMSTAFANTQESWVVSPSEATCLLDNLDAYLDSDNEPVVIFIKLCPETDPRRALRKLQKNSGVPSGPSVTITPDSEKFDEYIIYSQEELACLKGLSINSDAPLIRLPQYPCG